MSIPPDERVAWADEPDSTRGLFYPIWTATPDRPVNVVLLSEKLLGVHVHYFDRRTRPCTAPSGSCEGCGRGVDRRWKGYLAGWDRAKGRLGVVEVTREAYLRCGTFKERSTRLRGLVLRMERSGASKNSRVTAKLMEYAGPRQSLPPEFDVRAALHRVWFTDPAQNRGLRSDGPLPEDDASDGHVNIPLFPCE